jgi:RNA 3'-terminal phosphate cyclase (ATP)
VFLPIVGKMGYKAEIEIIREAFYPKGGAEVKIIVYPVKKLKSICLTNPGKALRIRGVSVAGSLPKDVAERQASAAVKVL